MPDLPRDNRRNSLSIANDGSFEVVREVVVEALADKQEI